MTKHPGNPVDLSTVEITVCSPGFLATGWACSEIRGTPKWLHPLVVQNMGCAVKYYDSRGLSSAVIFADYDLILNHELDHLRGHDDGTERFCSEDEAQMVGEAVAFNLDKYSDSCRRFEKGDETCLDYR